MSHIISGKKLHQWRQWATKLAKTNAIDPTEVDWFLQGLTPLTSTALRLDSYTKQPRIVLSATVEQLTQKWKQRVEDRVPVQYLTGETPWRQFSLTVTPDVLIPRPETELIISIADTLAAQSPIADERFAGDWADLGTGSGAIAIGLAHTYPEAYIHAVDISEKALAIAESNAEKNFLSGRIRFYQGSWLSPLEEEKGKLVGIVSNPPYIPSSVVPTLQPEVTKHEPHLALDGGKDGLDCIKHLIEASPDYLKPGGIWLTELMEGQAKTVTNLLTSHSSYTHINIHNDLSGIDRFVSARKVL